MKIIDNVYQKAVNSLKKHNVDYPKPNGKAYKVFKILYLVFAVLTALMTVFFVVGMLLVYSSNQEFISKFKPTAVFFLVSTAVFVVGIVLTLFKLDLIALAVNLISGSFSCFGLIKHMTNVALSTTGLHENWWWRHFLPFFFCIICLAVMSYIRTKAKYVELRAYKNLVQTIYKQNKDVQEMSEEEFNLFLENYDPRVIEEARIREKKQKEYKPLFDDKK